MKLLTLLTGLVFFSATNVVYAAGAGSADKDVQLPVKNESILENFLEKGVPEAPLRKAIHYYEANSGVIKNKEYITIIDFRQSSTRKRMYLLNMFTGRLQQYYVAHGVNSGNEYATEFSNISGSRQSSLGFILTGELYTGKYGLSMRMDGLEKQNSNVRRRAIVMHGAWYVSEDIIRQYGALGRSWGCPALEERHIKDVIRRIHGKSLVLKYR